MLNPNSIRTCCSRAERLHERIVARVSESTWFELIVAFFILSLLAFGTVGTMDKGLEDKRQEVSR